MADMEGEDGLQQYCLKWNNYQESLSSTFSDLLASGSFVDVSLACEGGQVVRAHRLLLSACSPFLRRLLDGLPPSLHPVILLRCVIIIINSPGMSRTATWQTLSTSSTTGRWCAVPSSAVQSVRPQVSIDQGRLATFLAAAESLRIRGLTGSVRSVADRLRQEGSQDPAPTEEYLVAQNNNPAPGSAAAQEEEMVPEEEELKEKNNHLQDLFQRFLGGPGGAPGLRLPPVGPEDCDTSQEAPGLLGGDGGDSGVRKTCPFCLQQLSWHALSRHIRDIHSENNSDMVICQYCRKTFRNKNSLGCHIWRFHKRGKELIGKDHTFEAN